MAASPIVDAGFLVALLSRRDGNHAWAVGQAPRYPPPWTTCDAVLSEAFHLLGKRGLAGLAALLRRGALVSDYQFADDADAVIRLMEKHSNVPMSIADACLVRMTETLSEPVVLTTDSDFRIYRRYGRQVVPCVLPA